MKISGLPVVADIDGTESIVLVKAGTTKRSPLQLFLDRLIALVQPSVGLARDWASKTPGVEVDTVSYPGLRSARSYAADAQASYVAAYNLNLADDYDGLFSLELDSAGSFIAGRNSYGELLGRLGVDIGISNGLSIAFNPATSRTVISLGTQEGVMPLSADGSITQFVDDYDGFQDLYLDRDGNIIGKLTKVPAPDFSAELITARGSQASLDTRLAQFLTPEGYPKEPIWNRQILRSWRAKLMLITSLSVLPYSHAVLGLVGDSYQAAAQTPDLFSRLTKTYGEGGLGWIPFTTTTSSGFGADGRQAVNPNTTGRTGSASWIAGTSVVAFTGRGPDTREITTYTVGDRVRVDLSNRSYAATFNVMYLRRNGGGAFRYRVAPYRTSYANYATLSTVTNLPAGTLAEVPTTDGGTHTDPVSGGMVANNGIFRWSASPAGWERLYAIDGMPWTAGPSTDNGGADALGQLQLTLPASPTGQIIELETTSEGTNHVTWFGGNHLRTDAWGVVLQRLAQSASDTAVWAALGAVSKAAIAALNCDAFYIQHGTNDQAANRLPAAYGANLATIVGYLRAGTPTCDFALAASYENAAGRSNAMTTFRDEAFRQAWALGCCHIDLCRHFGSIADYGFGSRLAWFTAASDPTGVHPATSGPTAGQASAHASAAVYSAFAL